MKSLVVCLASGFAFGLNLPVHALEPGKIWVASWTGSPQGPYPAGWAVAQPDLSFALPRGDTDGAMDQTFQLIVKPDLWSKTIRLRLSNTFGSRPIKLGATTVGIQSAGGNLLAGKAQKVLFSGNPEVVIPAGEEIYSDEAALDIDPTDPDTAVVCAFGDSITNGVNSTLNGSDSWPDALSRRLHEAYGNKIVVANEAISGNTVDSARPGGTTVNGPASVDRLDRDVFGVAGLRAVIWLEGINDLGAGLASADQVIKGYKEVIERLHAKKLKVIGATIVSSFGSPIASYGFPKVDTERKKVNAFIRTGGLFDAVADFDAATLDPETGAVKPPFQPNVTTGGAGDLFHPNRAGYQAMAETVNVKLLAPSPRE